MKKLDKEHLPKVIALGVMGTGLLGYAAWSWLGHGGGAAAPAAASMPHAATATRPDAAPRANDPVLALAPINHENPFVPSFQATSAAPSPPKPAIPAAAKPAPPKASATPGKASASLPDMITGPAMDSLPGIAFSFPGPGAPFPAKAQAPQRAVPQPAKPAPAAKPARTEGPRPPAAVVTGIIEGQENVAILNWPGSRGQVVRTGDRLNGGYVVKEIRSDAVVLVLGASRWVVRLGAEANKQ